MYRVVFEETGIAYDFPSREIYRTADKAVMDMDNGTTEGRQRIAELCAAEGVSLLEKDSTWKWRRDWPERAAWCLAWSWAKPTPSAEIAVDEHSGLLIGSESYVIDVPDRSGKHDSAEAIANARLFAEAGNLLNAARSMLAGDRKAKAELQRIVSRLGPPEPIQMEPAAAEEDKPQP